MHTTKSRIDSYIIFGSECGGVGSGMAAGMAIMDNEPCTKSNSSLLSNPQHTA